MKTKKAIPQNTRRKNTSEKVLEAAESLFIEKGFEGVSISDIAKKSKVKKALIFYYFTSKEELFNAILDRYYKAQAEILITSFGEGGSRKEKIHAGVDAYLHFIEKNPGYPRLIMGEICSNTNRMEKILEHMKPLQTWGNLVFQEMFPRKGPLSPQHFFITIFGMIVNYFTYMPVLKILWEKDLLAPQELLERRKHLHLIMDTLIDKFIKEEKN